MAPTQAAAFSDDERKRILNHALDCSNPSAMQQEDSMTFTMRKFLVTGCYSCLRGFQEQHSLHVSELQLVVDPDGTKSVSYTPTATAKNYQGGWNDSLVVSALDSCVLALIDSQQHGAEVSSCLALPIILLFCRSYLCMGVKKNSSSSAFCSLASI